MKLAKILINAALFSSLLTNYANASGYSSNLTSTSALANSYAGSSTGIHDASDMFFNPAILADINNSQFVASFSYLDLDVDIDNLKKDGNPANGSEISDAGEDALIPALYYATNVNDKIDLGLALTVPFGLATKYNNNWGAKDESLENKIEAYNINPNFSYKINNKLAIGFGGQVQYMKSAFLKHTDLGGAKTYAQDWGYGYNFGLKYNIDNNIKFGLGYRSKIDHKFAGYTRITAIDLRKKVNYKLTTPESLSAGLSGNINSKTQLAFDVIWNRWSRLNQINFIHDNILPNETTTFKWSDSFMYSLGLNYDYDNKLKIRSAIAYEKDSVNDSYRGFAVPTGDRIWTSLGLNYKLQKDLSVDITYLHQFHSSEKILNDNNNGYSAISKTNVNVLSLGFNKEF
ncbi:outer membrane protein transport protein [Rickettsiales bacterium]|nr:outer membrane protein transport protein [Rickettsiales bacterium]